MTSHDDNKIPELLKIGQKISLLPVIHGSGQFAVTVRRWMLEHSFDCIAVPLPASFRSAVEAAVLELPRPSIVIQPPTTRLTAEHTDWQLNQWEPETDEPDAATCSYIPIDPCQSVIMSIRAAMGEHIPREYIDLETDPFLPYATTMPDPFAVRHVAPEKFAAAVLPTIVPPADQQTRQRMVHTWRLHQLEIIKQILLVTMCFIGHGFEMRIANRSVS